MPPTQRLGQSRTLRFLSLIACSLIAGLLAPARAAGASPAPAKGMIPPDVIVAADGTGNFSTIQAALESIPRESRERRVILVKNGLYAEKIRIDAACVTLRGESRDGTRIEFAQGAGEFRAKRDDLGQAVVNITANGNDFVLENLTIKNTHGVIGTHAFAVFGAADRTVIMDCDILSQGNDTLSLWRTADRKPTGELPDGLQANGRYYHARLKVRGSVDFICPRGWCYMTDSVITEVNPKAEAAIWHDGSRDPSMKFVLRNCQFDGVENWGFARWHHDAQFFLLDCTFSKAMRDHAPFRVIYPLAGGEATAADRKRNDELAPTNLWGNRAYFYQSHRTGGDYPWHQDNLAQAPGSPRPSEITAEWTFGGTWNPEKTVGPRVVKIDRKEARLELTFDETVTVKGYPSVVLAQAAKARYVSGSGTRTLVFDAPAGTPLDPTRLDFAAGAVIASEAAANLRFAAPSLPSSPL